MNNLRLKTDLYIVSLGLLFVFFIIITVDIPVYFGSDWEFVGTKKLLVTNLVPCVSLIVLFYCIYAYRRFLFSLKGSAEIPFTITKLQSINYEHLTFLATYVIPLISFDFKNPRQLLVLSLLLIVMGIIYIKTDLFYANPSLALLGFHIFEADGNFKTGERKNIILICRGRLQIGMKVKYIKLDDRIYFVKGVTQ